MELRPAGQPGVPRPGRGVHEKVAGVLRSMQKARLQQSLQLSAVAVAFVRGTSAAAEGEVRGLQKV